MSDLVHGYQIRIKDSRIKTVRAVWNSFIVGIAFGVLFWIVNFHNVCY